jgi:hypothetical protein
MGIAKYGFKSYEKIYFMAGNFPQHEHIASHGCWVSKRVSSQPYAASSRFNSVSNSKQSCLASSSGSQLDICGKMVL